MVDLKRIADLRGLSVEGVTLAAKERILFCLDSREGRAWVVSDSERINAQARRLDGRPWESLEDLRHGRLRVGGWMANWHP